MTTASDLRLAGVREVDPGDCGWDAFVRAKADSSVAHLAAWKDIIENVLGQRYHALAAADDAGRLAGVLPLVNFRAAWGTRRLVSLPFLNYGGPVGTPEAEAELLAAACVRALERTGGRLQLRCRHALSTSIRPSDAKVLVLLSLPRDADDLWRSFPGKLRSQVRRPRKAGLRFSRGSEHVDAFYDVFARNMRDLGTPVYPRTFFHAIAERIPEAEFAAVYDGAQPVAGACGFRWQGEFEITWASALRSHSRSAPNMLLYWSLMEDMIAAGLHTFNFGRSTPDTGTHRFKLQWGGRDEVLPWLEWPEAERPRRPSHGARLASSLWRKLPLPVANALGPRIAPRLPWW